LVLNILCVTFCDVIDTAFEASMGR